MTARSVSPNRVLPTLNADGTRRRVRPRLFKGRFYRGRLLVAWGLLVTFAALPFVRVGGKPLVLLDVARREFTLFGRTFLPTDGVLLMLLLLAIFAGVVWITALVGRAWCGWACPQTVYMEFVFRPIERLLEGDRGRAKGLRRLLRHVVFAALSVLVGNLFLSYFVGTSALLAWVQASPLAHPGPFLVMGATAVLTYLDFGWFREQMCTVVCPYARLQSVFLDTRSLVIGYDARRGETRGKGRVRDGLGDCVDCNACVAACPTGIDIRDGLQLECISCAQCVDACDGVMRKLHKPLGLIRYTSQAEQESGHRGKLLRPRVVIYGVLVVGLISALLVAGRAEPAAEVMILRGTGAPYVAEPGGVRNQIRVKIANRTAEARSYHLEVLGIDDGSVVVPQNPFRVEAQRHATTTIFTIAPADSFGAGGERRIVVRVDDGHGFGVSLPYRILGPARRNEGGT